MTYIQQKVMDPHKCALEYNPLIFAALFPAADLFKPLIKVTVNKYLTEGSKLFFTSETRDQIQVFINELFESKEKGNYNTRVMSFNFLNQTKEIICLCLRSRGWVNRLGNNHIAIFPHKPSQFTEIGSSLTRRRNLIIRAEEIFHLYKPVRKKELIGAGNSCSFL